MSIACHLRRGAVSLTIAALPAIAVASAPSSIADDCLSSPLSFACMGDEFLLEGLGGGNGDPSQVAVAPEPPASSEMRSACPARRAVDPAVASPADPSDQGGVSAASAIASALSRAVA